MRYHLILIEMAILKREAIIKVAKCRKKGNLTLPALQIGTDTVENSMEVPQKGKNRTTI